MRAPRLQVAWTASLIVALPVLAGCGGNSQSSLRRYALKNPPENDAKATPKTNEQAPLPSNRSADAAQQKSGLPAATASPPATAVSASATAASNVTGQPQTERLPSGSGPIQVVVRNEKPAEPLSAVQRRNRSLKNLEKIGSALTAYVAARGTLPALAIENQYGEKVLSWRVAILPELGYAALYEQFNANESWDSPHNKALLDQIPPEFQSPERFDTSTNYVGLAGTGMVFGRAGAMTPAAVKDGLENTVFLVEADNRFASPWTRPREYMPDMEDPAGTIGGPRAEGVFALLANGRVAMLPRNLSSSLWAAFYSATGGESANAAKLLLTPQLAPETEPAPAVAAGPPSVLPVKSDSQPASRLSLATTGSSTPPPDAVPASTRTPIPAEEDLAKARAFLKDLYQADFAAAKSSQERQAFVRKLLAEAEKLERSPAAMYELLQIVRKTAADLGDSATALKSCAFLEKKFEVAGAALRLQALEDLVKSGTATPVVGELMKEAQRVVDDAFEADQFDVALKGQALLLNLVRKEAAQERDAASGGRNSSDPHRSKESKAAKIQRLSGELETARTAFESQQRARISLQSSPKDAAANEAVGKYLCLIKNRWEEGLPYLARSADSTLRGLASFDLEPERSPPESFALAEQYWELAETYKPPCKRGLQLRAVYLYELAARAMSNSIEKTKSQKRIEEAVAIYSRATIDQVLLPLKKKAAASTSSDDS